MKIKIDNYKDDIVHRIHTIIEISPQEISDLDTILIGTKSDEVREFIKSIMEKKA